MRWIRVICKGDFAALIFSYVRVMTWANELARKCLLLIGLVRGCAFDENIGVLMVWSRWRSSWIVVVVEGWWLDPTWSDA